jgi:hypothetical protein
MGGAKGLAVKKAVFYQTKAQTVVKDAGDDPVKKMLCPIIKYKPSYSNDQFINVLM